MAQINKPTDYFNTKLFVGTGASQSITGVGFQPDFTWIKNRNSIDWHWLQDAVRGATKVIFSNTSNAESTQAQGLTSFNSDGFTVGTDTGNNGSGNNIVSWNWLGANGTASNTDGSITSTVSANTTSGFSIVTYTGNGSAGAMIGHGLGTTPSFIIIKSRSSAYGWYCYHKGIDATAPEDYFIRLDTTDARVNSPAILNDTAPTNSVITLGSNVAANGSGLTYVAYCFAPKKGFSAMGQYTGNGSTDGTFVYTGFKSAFVMFKNITNGAVSWYMFDNKRNGYNGDNKSLRPNTSDTETSASNYPLDILSNGFKLLSTNNEVNGSGDTYIYTAFAENPLVGTNNIPATAR